LDEFRRRKEEAEKKKQKRRRKEEAAAAVHGSMVVPIQDQSELNTHNLPSKMADFNTSFEAETLRPTFVLVE
jgi:hypothetical protein